MTAVLHFQRDFHCALLWLRSIEIVVGHSPVIMLSEVQKSVEGVR